MRSLQNVVVATVILTGIATSPLCAQNEAPSRPSPQPDCRADAAPPLRSDETTGRAPFSDRLAESKGVICPPKGVDPGIVDKPPANNSLMPVIPPPGTPGGDPETQPK